MSRFERTPGNDSSIPERMRSEGGTALERRLLEAAANEQPSRELVEKMALGIGIAPPAPTPFHAPAPDASSIAPKVATVSKALFPWVSGAIAVAVAAAIWGTRSISSSLSPSSSHSATPRVSASTAPPALSAVLPENAASAPEASPSVAPTAQAPRSRSTGAVADIQEQIALLDAARAAVASGSAGRALELVRQYQAKYPTGSFRPEATALKIEALVKSGRLEEAKSLAQRFVAEHRGTPLADRVSRLIGATRP